MKVTRWLRLCSKLLLMLLGITTLSQSVHAYYIIRRVGLLSTCGYQDIQSAIDNVKTVNGVTGVNILVDAKYVYNQSLTINGKNVNITGGFADCTEDTPSYGERSQLVGNGGSVITITGVSNVTLSGMDISGGNANGADAGHPSGSDGGGILFGASGSLTIVNSSVHDNVAADSGGGIAFTGIGPTKLILDSQSIVSGNHAITLGGGILLVGPVDAYVSGIIGNNHSTGSGGGVAAVGGEFGTPTLYLYSTSGSPTARISENTAASLGGGIFLYPNTGHASFCAQDFAVDSNTASDGAAIYADTDEYDNGSPSSIYLNHIGCADPASATPPIQCGHAGQVCNEIDDNTANTTNGGTVTIKSGVIFQGERFEAMRNSGATLLSEVNSAGLVNCLLAENTLTQYLIDMQAYENNSIQLHIDGCTLAYNSEGYGFTIQNGADETEIYNSIFFDTPPSKAITNPYNLTPSYILAGTSDDSLGTASTIIHGIPTFVAAHDYHLSPNSLGVDFAPLLISDADLDGRQRDVDLANIANYYGAVDLGAYEIQDCGASDTIFCSTFE